MEHFEITYNLFKELSYELLERIRKNNKEYKAILCPLRGGFFFSYFMSKKLNIPMNYIEISSYEEKIQKDFHVGIKSELDKGLFLLCDDIYDTGNTTKKIHDLYPEANFDTACLISKVDTPDIYYGKLIDSDVWVDFFWEVM